jgi:glycogen debranching enzyme
MYFDAIGNRGFLCGVEDGPLECWIWPWQIFCDARFSFLPKDALEPFDLAHTASAIEVQPHATRVSYLSADAAVDVLAFSPDDEAAAFLWLDVDVDAPGTLFLSFRPRLQPEWPAGIGGVAATFDAPLGAFVLSEPSGRVAAAVGSPWATRASKGEQYLLPDGDLRLEIPVDPERARRERIPIAIALEEGERAPERVRESFARLVRASATLLERHAKRWDERARSIPVLRTGGALDEAFFWNSVSLEQGRVKTDALGEGLVAGYAAAGPTSQRPGFAWFFTGDVGLNAAAYLGAGLADSLRAGLDLARRNARADGKIPHEVVLSAPLCDWFEKYPFPYIHGETTGAWIHACRQLVDHTGDRAFLDDAWPAIVAGYRWILAQDGDGDGLPDNARAGMGASEIGSLRQGLATDVYLAAASAVAMRDVADLAVVRGETELGKEARAAAGRACARIEDGFWDAQRKTIAHALLIDGSLSQERTPWPAIAVAWRLVGGEKARATMESIGAEDLTTPWGVRFLSSRSSAFEPKGYNTGAVWPFLTGIAALGDFEVGRANEGFSKLEAMARLTTSEALGRMPEVLSGTRERSLERAVPHQLFSSMAVVAPVVQGLFGYEPNALHGGLVLRPCFPDAWIDRPVSIEGLGFAASRIDLTITRKAKGYDVEYVVRGTADPVVILQPRNGAAGAVRQRAKDSGR